MRSHSEQVRDRIVVRGDARGRAVRCPYCHAPVGSREPRWRCAGCETVHHRECADENERCAVHGCGRDEGREERGLVVRVERRPAGSCTGCLASIGGTATLWLCHACGARQHLDCLRARGACVDSTCGSLDGEIVRHRAAPELAEPRGRRRLDPRLLPPLLVCGLWVALLVVTLTPGGRGDLWLVPLTLLLPFALRAGLRLAGSDPDEA